MELRCLSITYPPLILTALTCYDLYNAIPIMDTFCGPASSKGRQDLQILHKPMPEIKIQSL
jgi:hypothetical protein